MLYLIILSIILYILIVKYNNNIIIKSIIFGLLFGIIAYNFIPFSDYDLARHHLFVKGFMHNNNISYLISKINLHEFEFLPTVYSYFIAKLNNINLTQFIIVSLGYGIMYYLVSDYSKNNNIKKIYNIIIMFFTIFGFYVLYFISGLYFYIGVIIFALAFYLDYYKDVKKPVVYFLYLISFLFHDTLFFPLLLLILFKIFKNKLNIFSIIVISILIYFSYFILSYLSTFSSFEFLKQIVKLYNTYMLNGNYMQRLYRGNIFFIEISKLIIVLISVFLTKKNKKISSTNNFILLIAFSTIFMMTKSIVMIRFCMLVQLLGIIPLIEYLKNNKKNIIMYLLISLLDIYYIIYFVYVLHNQLFNFIF